MGLDATIPWTNWEGERRSDHSRHYAPVWFDSSGIPRAGPPTDAEQPVAGIAGFDWILRDGELWRNQSWGRHPRTAIGIDKRRRYLHLMVVDGRQKGHSVGLDTRLLGRRLLELGCHDALNLDGGGSSIMVLADRHGVPTVVNSPSTRIFGQSIPRPIPVAFCILPSR
jgi:hypothetical protein